MSFAKHFSPRYLLTTIKSSIKVELRQFMKNLNSNSTGNDTNTTRHFLPHAPNDMEISFLLCSLYFSCVLSAIGGVFMKNFPLLRVAINPFFFVDSSEPA
jgi:hypothetical protein